MSLLQYKRMTGVDVRVLSLIDDCCVGKKRARAVSDFLKPVKGERVRNSTYAYSNALHNIDTSACKGKDVDLTSVEQSLVHEFSSLRQHPGQ